MKVLIVDDEPLACSRMARLCAQHADLDVVGQAESGADAIDAIATHHPDVVLLDIELQDMSGFEVLRTFGARDEPGAILITAHPEHAVKAFEIDVIDYLTKPIEAQRFGAAIERARERCSGKLVSSLRAELAAELRATLGEQGDAPGVLRHLVGEKAHRMYFIDAEKVDYIESDGNYVTIHTGEDRYIARGSIKHLAQVLARPGFVRIERSLLLNLTRVAFAERVGHGKFAFTLHSGSRVVSGAIYRRDILNEMRSGRLVNLKRPH